MCMARAMKNSDQRSLTKMEDKRKTPIHALYSQSEEAGLNGIETSNGYSKSLPEETIGSKESSEMVVCSQKPKAKKKTKPAAAEEPSIITMRKPKERDKSHSFTDRLQPLPTPLLDPTSPASQQELGKEVKIATDQNMDVDLATKVGLPPNLDSESGENRQESCHGPSCIVTHRHLPARKRLQTPAKESNVMHFLEKSTFKMTKRILINSKKMLENVTGGRIQETAKILISINPSSYCDKYEKKVINSHVSVKLIDKALNNYEQGLTSYTLVARSNVIDIDSHMKCSPRETRCPITVKNELFTILLALETDLLQLPGNELMIEYDLSLQPTPLYQVADEGEFAAIYLTRE